MFQWRNRQVLVFQNVGGCIKKVKHQPPSWGNLYSDGGPTIFNFNESNLYRSWGADVIGMTNMPEAKLAEKLKLDTTVAMVTDYDCWHPDHEEVDVSMVVQTLMKMQLTHKIWLKK